MVSPNREREVRRATTGSAGLDIRATTRLVLTPEMGVQTVDSDWKGIIPKDSVGLLLGRSSTALKGLIVHPGVIDSDCEGKVKILVSSPKGVTVISPGDRIAQMLILPSQHSLWPSEGIIRDKQGFGSTGDPMACLTLGLGERPLLKLKVGGVQMLGLLDTGADKSIISALDWPKHWPLVTANQTLRGLGIAHSPSQSASTLPWKDEEGHSGVFQPYVCNLPISLWGRDVLQQMDMKLTTDIIYQGTPVKDMLQKMGYKENKGLGKLQQGMVQPVPLPTPKNDTSGLGFS